MCNITDLVLKSVFLHRLYRKFPVGAKIEIDGRREGAFLRHMGSTEGDIYTVCIHGINFEVNLPADRLSIVRDNEPKQTRPVWAHVCMQSTCTRTHC